MTKNIFLNTTIILNKVLSTYQPFIEVVIFSAIQNISKKKYAINRYQPLSTYKKRELIKSNVEGCNV